MADSRKLSLIEIQKQLHHRRATTTDIYLKQLVKPVSSVPDILEEAGKKNAQNKKWHPREGNEKTMNHDKLLKKRRGRDSNPRKRFLPSLA